MDSVNECYMPFSWYIFGAQEKESSFTCECVNVSLFQDKVPTLVDFPSHCEFDNFVPT